jgi:hypothetical protein
VDRTAVVGRLKPLTDVEGRRGSGSEGRGLKGGDEKRLGRMTERRYGKASTAALLTVGFEWFDPPQLREGGRRTRRDASARV